MTTNEDKDAEALMQRMIDEGRLHTKRQRTSTRSGSQDALRHSTSAVCDVASILTAANGCGLNLSMGGSGSGGDIGGGDVSVKEELAEVSLGHGSLVPVTGAASSRQFDNLYLAYSAAMQKAAVGGIATSEAMEYKSSQNLLLAGAATMQSFAGASTLDGSSVDAQAAQVNTVVDIYI